EAAFTMNQPFEHQVLLKSEHNWNSGADYAGITLNWRQISGNDWGEYFNLSLDNGWSFYAEANHTPGSHARYPTVQNGAGQSSTALGQIRQAENKIYTQAVAGAKYSFIGGSDLRLEYVYDEASYTAYDQNLLRSALLSSSPVQLAASLQGLSTLESPGLEFP